MSIAATVTTDTAGVRWRGNIRLCNARNNTCGAPAMRGIEKCRVHGGASPRGVAAARYQHGRYSKDLPTAIAGRYKAALNDEQMLDMSQEVALLTTRLGLLLGKMQVGDTAATWAAARELMADFRIASRDHKLDEATKALDALETLLGRGASEYARWAEVREIIDDRRKVVESERKRMVELKQYITAERALLFVGAIEGIIRARVKDPAVMATIGRDIRSLIGEPVESGADSVGASDDARDDVPSVRVAEGAAGEPRADSVIDG